MPAVGVPAIGTTALGGETGITHDPPVVASVAASTAADLSANSTVTWAYTQPQGRPQDQYRVQGKNSAGSTTYYDSGWLSGAVTAHTVSLDDEGIPVAAVNKWVVSAIDTVGSISSEVSANVTYAWGNPQVTMSTVEGVTVPVDGRMTITQAANVTLAWSFSDGGNTQSAYRVRVLDSGTDIELHTSGWVSGAGTTYDIPFTFTHGMTYELRLQVKNNYGVRSS
jgi:hypothetical protein